MSDTDRVVRAIGHVIFWGALVVACKFPYSGWGLLFVIICAVRAVESAK
jgi:hypothetical protein